MSLDRKQNPLVTPAEVRADMVAELRAAARMVESVAVFHPSMAATARGLASQHRRQADQIESSVEPRASNSLADESKAELMDFKLNSAASSSADNFKSEMERAA